MQYIILLSFAIAFFATFLATQWWIHRAKQVGLVGKDMNKYGHPLIPEMGGIPIIFGFVLSILFYISIRTFVLKTDNHAIPILAMLVTVFIAFSIGIVDSILEWKVGLRKITKLLLTFMLPIPLIVTNAGYSVMSIPFIGTTDLGLLYPFLIIPIIIISTANLFNILAGYNGLESGMGIIILTVMGFSSYSIGLSWVTTIALCMVFSLLAFFIFNKFPAKIFPGDSMTYSIGALIGVLAIIGSTEKILLVLFIPYFFEQIIK